jgi:4-oxalocrotonate tautomerase
VLLNVYNQYIQLSYVAGEVRTMPIVQVFVWKGFGEDKAKTLITNITKVFGELGIPEQAVEIVITEIQKSHWGIGGVPASEKFKNI